MTMIMPNRLLKPAKTGVFQAKLIT